MKDNDLLELNSGLDQPIRLELSPIDRVDEIVSKAVQDEDITSAISEAKQALSLARISGLFLAKLLYKLEKNWNKFYIDNDSFVDYIHVELGIAPITILRYCRVWSMFESKLVPPELEDQLKMRPLRDLVAISTAVSQEYDIPQTTWETLTSAENSSVVSETLRQIKGTEPRSGSLVLKLKRNGDIQCWSGGEQHFVGYVSLEDENESVQAAIERIINGAGLIRE
jgi:hypothetical protein